MKLHVKSAQYSDVSQVYDLAEEYLYQTWENYPEYDLNDAFENTLRYCIEVITEHDEYGDYLCALDLYNTDEQKFEAIIRDYVVDHYDDYRWWS